MTYYCWKDKGFFLLYSWNPGIILGRIVLELIYGRLALIRVSIIKYWIDDICKYMRVAESYQSEAR